MIEVENLGISYPGQTGETIKEFTLGVFPAFWVYAILDTLNSLMIFILGMSVLIFINYISFVYVLKDN